MSYIKQIKKAPTKLQIKTLFIFKHLEIRLGYSPTLREMSGFAGRTPKAIFDRFLALTDKGLITSTKGANRSCRLTDFGKDLMEEK